MPYGRALVGAGNLAWRMGELDRARGLYEQALSVLSQVGTDQQIGSVYLNLGNIAFSRGENDEAERHYEKSLDYYRRANSTIWIAGCLTNLSVIALAREDLDRLETMQSESLQINEEAGIRDGICLCLLQLGIAAYIRRDYDLGRALWDRAMALAREIDHSWSLMPDPSIALPIFEAVASLVADTRPAESASLLAAATALRVTLKMPLLSYELPATRDLEARLTGALSDEDLAGAREAGAQLSVVAALSAAERLVGVPTDGRRSSPILGATLQGEPGALPLRALRPPSRWSPRCPLP
ncbi:MAG: tetratricopeptide repeat protein [Candidatus Eisenbacteria bacterium]|uniref:Tetratricopeptide repeat protein n=1 Tax=Eiseniibacteriota bacterium TaxID=2212470 RepID=A0A849SUQ3_UNCEI|nr:tetratricopeptide repeat protein [Candidatus Eisenbacteria bacterium]